MQTISDPIRIFIGFDQVEAVAYHTLCQSIIDHTTNPVSITPVKVSHLLKCFLRERDAKQSNEFSFSRFLVPWMCNYEGWAIFMDCDMLLRDDISKLWNKRDYTKAIQVVKHDYTPKNDTKYLGNTQHKYEKKNWSSVMLFNNAKCDALTPKYVNTASGLELHQFKWLSDDNLIGELDKEWNHLVGEYEYNPEAKIVHFTVGGPYFHEYENCDYAEEWREASRRQRNCQQLNVPRLKVSEK